MGENPNRQVTVICSYLAPRQFNIVGRPLGRQFH